MRLAGAIAIAVVCVGARAYADGEAVNGFPNWQERVMLEWTNRARCDPQVEMQACGANCGEGACYTPQPPVKSASTLNHSARFHSDEMHAQGYFAHDSACTLVSNIDALYPATCTGAASCACTGGTMTCNPACTTWDMRVALFGSQPSGEIIASGTDPNGAFYQWLFEPFTMNSCGYHQGPPTNGHRYNLLMAGPAVGFGAGAGASVGDFGSGGTVGKIASGSHYPRSGATVDAWANWHDTAGPMSAMINVDGTCTALTLGRGAVTNGAYHVALTGLSSACHRYFFLFHDSTDTVVTYPTTGSLGIGPAGSCADWDTSRPPTGTGCSCTPQCAGKQCGDDGCGGSCGNCMGTDVCQVDMCVAAPPPDAGMNNNNGDDTVPPGVKGGCGCDTSGRADLTLIVGVGVVVLRRRRRQR